MQAFHIYTGADGHSHIDVVEMVLTTPYPGNHPEGAQSARLVSDGLYFTEVGPGHAMQAHSPSRRQLLIVLQGRYQIACASGESVVLGAGDILVAEDVGGSGHSTTELTGHGRAMAVPIPDFATATSVFRLRYGAEMASVAAEEGSGGAEA